MITKPVYCSALLHSIVLQTKVGHSGVYTLLHGMCVCVCIAQWINNAEGATVTTDTILHYKPSSFIEHTGICMA